jgi:hypothetical protein
MMVGEDRGSAAGTDPDDWFSGSTLLDDADERTLGDAHTDEHTSAAVREPGWLDDDAAADQKASPVGRAAEWPWRRIAQIAGVAIVLLLAVLAAAGVFSGGGSTSTPPPATTGPATTTTPTTPASTTPATPAATLPATVLKPGSSGDDVKTLQRALASAGQSPGTVDGVYGPKTEAAVTAFQTSAGITADGIYGPKTKAALEQQLNAG